MPITRSFVAILSSLTLLTLTACEQSSNDTQSTDAAEPDKALTSGVELAYMDTSVSPAENFYHYANGTWLNTTEIPADKARYGSFTALTDKARDDVRDLILESADSDNKSGGLEAQQIGDFYRSFMDTDTIESRGTSPLKPLFDEIVAIDNLSDLATVIGKGDRAGIRSPLSFYIDTDEKQPDQYIAYLGQAGLGLPDRDYYLKNDEQSETIKQAYKQHITTMFALTGLPDGDAAATKIFTMESSIAQHHWPRAELRNREKTYNKYSKEELLKLSEKMDWNSWLDAVGLDGSDALVLSTPSYFESLDQLLTDYSLDDWKVYMQWRTLSSYADLLSSEVEQEDFNFYSSVLSGIEEQEDRWKRAVGLENRLLGDAIGKIYVKKHFSPDAKERMVTLVENLREAYRQGITDLEWMSEDTKKKAIEKLEKFTPKIGYPDQWKDLSGLEIKPDDLFGNYVRATRFYHQFEVDKLGKPVDRHEWFMNPQTVNAYYNPGMNEIVFPAAILQPPFFDMEADDAINYGAIGGVIGHEMGHGFDDQGAKSDGDGLLENWWTDQDLTEFQSRTQKLVDQYNGFTVLDDLHINGQLTLGENIGDLGGLTIAHRAYLLSRDGKPGATIDGFTGEQRFFLGWAQVWANKYRDEALRQLIVTDPHSPPRFRANGVLRNMPEFYKAYDVKEGDGMYLPPEKRVKIW